MANLIAEMTTDPEGKARTTLSPPTSIVRLSAEISADAEAKARTFNNAGVDCLNRLGLPRVAWDLFRGALEIKLTNERSNKNRIPADRSYESNKYVRKAEFHLQSIGCSLNQTTTDANHESGQGLSMRSRLSFRDTELGKIETYEPYLCSASFCIADKPAQNAQENIKRERSSSASIIFNLALIEHLYSRQSSRAMSLYELATTLVVDERVGPFEIALLNNTGVCCFEKGDMVGAQRHMNRLSKFMNRHVSPAVCARDRDCLVSNILWMLNNATAASPAA